MVGYSQLGKEIVEQLPQITSLFIPVGSGTTLLGISQCLPQSVKIFAAQPASHCPIASQFDDQFTPESETITDALSVNLLPLKSKVINAIRNSNGSGVVVQNQAVASAQKFLTAQNILVSAEGALALAAYYKVQKSNICGNYPVILLTGTKR